MVLNSMFICVLFNIGVNSGWGHDNPSATGVYVMEDEFLSFKKAILNDFKQMKEREHEMKNEIIQLKSENEEKDMKIMELEGKVNTLEKCQENGLIRRRSFGYGHIAFTAYLNHGVHNLTQDQPVIYNKVLLNDGDGYDLNTGVFTAPVSGVYLFSYSVGAKLLPNVHLSQYDVFTRLIVNGVHQLSAVAESTSTYDDEQGSTTAIVYVEEATTVWTKHEFRGGNNLYSDESERVTSFTGTLLYEKEIAIDSGIIG